MSEPKFTIKNDVAADFGMQYSAGAEDMQWHRQYRSFTSHAAFNAELVTIAEATEVQSPDGTLLTHTATFQPFKHPKPGAKPSEDRHVFQIWGLPSGNWTFAGVFDGHAGQEVAEYAHRVLPAQIRQALETIDATSSSPGSILAKCIEEFDKSIAEKLKALVPPDFSKMDDESLKKLVNDQESGGKVYNACIRCMRGSTVTVALIDPKKENLWVANLGDCQAILAEYLVREPNDCKATLLSSPHNARVDKEAQRIHEEHPDEPEAVLNDRVLGAIAVSRALGDFTFKLPSVYTTKLFLQATPGYRISTKIHEFLPRNLTPPYVSATPEITHYSLKARIDSDKHFKYVLVVCSDGLTDPYYSRNWTPEYIARHVASVCLKPDQELWGGFNGNLALRLLKDALGSDLEEQSRNLTVDLDFQHLDDTTAVVLSW